MVVFADRRRLLAHWRRAVELGGMENSRGDEAARARADGKRGP